MPATVPVGTVGQLLTSGGAGVAPTFQAAASLTRYENPGRGAVGTTAFTGTGTPAVIITVGAVTYPEKDAPTVTLGEWTNGSSSSDSATNLTAAINGDTRNGGGNSYAAVASTGTVSIMALAVGTAGNVTVSDDQAQPSISENLIGGEAATTKQMVTIEHTVTAAEAAEDEVVIPLSFDATFHSWTLYDSSGAIKSDVTDDGLTVDASGAVPSYFHIFAAGGTHIAEGDVVHLIATD